MTDPLQVKSISLSAIEAGETESRNLNTDVIVNMTNGDTYVATFYTHDKILHSLRDSSQHDTSHYVWFRDLVLVETITQQHIETVIDEMIDEGDFQVIFEKYGAA